MRRKIFFGAVTALYIVLVVSGTVAWLPLINDLVVEDIARDPEGNIYATRQGNRNIHVYKMDADGNAVDFYRCWQEAREVNNYIRYADGKLYICQIWYYWDEKGMLCFSVWEKKEEERVFRRIWKKELSDDVNITDFHVENGRIFLTGVEQDKEDILLYRWEDGKEKDTIRFESGFIPTEVHWGNDGLFALSHDNNVCYIDINGKKTMKDIKDAVMLCTDDSGIYYQQTDSRDLRFIFYSQTGAFTYHDIGDAWDVEYSAGAMNWAVLLNDGKEDMLKIISQDGFQKQVSQFRLKTVLLLRLSILPFFVITMAYAAFCVSIKLLYGLVWSKRKLLYQTMAAVVAFSAVWIAVTIIMVYLLDQKNGRVDRIFYATTSRDIQAARMNESISADLFNELVSMQDSEASKVTRDIFMNNTVKTAWMDFFIREELLYDKDEPTFVFSEEAAYGRKASTFYTTGTVAKIGECMNSEEGALSFCDKVDGITYAIAVKRIGMQDKPLCLVSRVPVLGVGHKKNDLQQFYLGAVLGWMALMAALGFYLKKKWDSTGILVTQMDKVSKGDYLIGSRNVPNNEFGMMWTALERMSRRLGLRRADEKNIMEYIYQFTPKNFASLFGKESLEETEVGETVLLSATMGLISIMDKDTLLKGKVQKQYVQYVNQLMEILFSQNDSGQAVFLQDGSNLENMKVIFKGEEERVKDSAARAVHYSIDCIESLSEQTKMRYGTKPFILLHTSQFRCGIAGGSKQIYPYVSSIEMETLSLYITPLKNCDTRIVVTEATWECVKDGLDGRYIGYVRSKDVQYLFRLYEITDACPQQQRDSRRNSREQFADALELYYGDRFYDARNAFVQIHQKYPGDGIVNWYMSACDTLLRENMSARRHELFWDML